MFDSLPWGHLLGGVLQPPSCSWELYCLLWVAVQIGWKLLLFLLWTDLEAVQLCCLSFSSLQLWRVTCMDCMAEALCVLAADLKVVCGRKGSPRGLGLVLAGDSGFLRTLDSSIKRNTAVIKKLKQINEEQREGLMEDLRNVNLSKFVSEAVTSICDAKLRTSDIQVAVQLGKQCQTPESVHASIENQDNLQTSHVGPEKKLSSHNIWSRRDGWSERTRVAVKCLHARFLIQKKRRQEEVLNLLQYTSICSALLASVSSSFPIGFLSEIIDSKQCQTLESILASIENQENLQTSNVGPEKKLSSHNIWSRRGKPKAVLQLQTIRSREKNRGADINLKYYFPWFRSSRRNPYPGKENYSLNTLLMKSLKKKGKRGETQLSTSSKITFSPYKQPEEEMIASPDKENQRPLKFLQQTKLAIPAPMNEVKFKQDMVLEECKAEKVPLQSLLVNFSGNSILVPNDATINGISVNCSQIMRKASKSVSRSQQAGLQFPVGKIARFLKAGKYAERVGAGAPVYLSAVLDETRGKFSEIYPTNKISYTSFNESSEIQARYDSGFLRTLDSSIKRNTAVIKKLKQINEEQRE
uniref:Histone H2A n=1 Tax=Salix viminalis TaxID=40686 RepID=A0A6N2MS64_SALVM